VDLLCEPAKEHPEEKGHAMALDQSALLELLEALKVADVDERIRTATEALYQALIEAELTAVIGAAPHERTEARIAQRNGSRPRTLSTTAGDLELRIPKLRTGSFFPSLLERRRRIDQALFAVVMEAYLHGVSTRKVDDLVKALGADTGISKSEVSRICADLDEEVAAFRDRSLAETAFPYVFLDATYCRPGSTGGWSPRPSSSPPEWPPTATVRCSAARSATARTAPSGRRSCAR
jgi:putative transposase